jgi:hypothetical protein
MWRIPKNYKIQHYLGILLYNDSEYENKLIDDVVNAGGMTLKPAESQLKEFIRRLKSLNKDIVCDIINERLMKFDEMSNSEQSKILIVKISLM